MSVFVNTADVIGDEALTNSIIDRSITEIADNRVTKVGASAFYGCSALSKVDFPAVTYLGENAFYNCSNLTAVILRGETMVSRADANAFVSTPVSSGSGYVYVPRALVDSYKAADYWSAHPNRLRALEDYTVDGTTTGALDESKI